MFYTKKENGSLTAHNGIHTPNGSFTEANKNEAPEEYKWFDTPEEAYTYFASLNVSPLDQARSGMAALLGQLPDDSLARISGVWVSANNLLDVGKVGAAYQLIDSTPTITDDEANAKAIILGELEKHL